MQGGEAALTIVLLSAVAVVGLCLLGVEVLAARGRPGSVEQALAPENALGGLLNFEAPAQTAARVRTQTEEYKRNMRRNNDASLLVKNWKYTQNPIAAFMQLYLQALNQDLLNVQTAIANYVMLVQQFETTALSVVASFVNTLLTTYANLVNSIEMLLLFMFSPINNNNISSSSSSSHSVSPFR